MSIMVPRGNSIRRLFDKTCSPFIRQGKVYPGKAYRNVKSTALEDMIAAQGSEPLHAVYGTGCLVAMEQSLRRGSRRIVSFFPRIRVHSDH